MELVTPGVGWGPHVVQANNSHFAQEIESKSVLRMLVSWARFRQGSKPHNEGLEGQEPQTQSLLSREPQAREGPRPTARAVGSPGVPIQPPHTPPAPRPSSRPRDHPAAASPKPALRLLFVVEREGESGPTIPAAPTAVRFRFRRRTGISGVWFPGDWPAPGPCWAWDAGVATLPPC